MPSARHFISICALIAGCSTVPKETAKGKSVKVIKSPFAESCTQLAKLKYDGTPFIHDKELNIVLKELAAQAKGNAVRYDIFVPGVTGVSNAKGRATVYRCDSAKLAKYVNEGGGGTSVTQADDEMTDEGVTKPKPEGTTSLKARKNIKTPQAKGKAPTSGQGQAPARAPASGNPPRSAPAQGTRP